MLTSTCGAIASTAGVDLSLPPVAPADVPALFHPIIRTSTCGATKTITCGAFGVYLRWFRLHSAGVSLSIPPVAPADVPAIAAQELGRLPAVLQTFTCGAETRLPSEGCIPPVAVAQSLARRLPFG